jgi:hypothetical protein
MQERCAIFVSIVIVMTHMQRSAALNPSVKITCQQLVEFMPQHPVSLQKKTAGKKGRKQNVSK